MSKRSTPTRRCARCNLSEVGVFGLQGEVVDQPCDTSSKETEIDPIADSQRSNMVGERSDYGVATCVISVGIPTQTEGAGRKSARALVRARRGLALRSRRIDN